MIFLMFLVYFSIPTLLVFAVQYLFCQCRYAAVKLIPTIAAFVFLVWVLSSRRGPPEGTIGCPTGAGITVFFVGGIFAALFIGVVAGWLVYLSRSGSGEGHKNEGESEG
ncbi:hypothetical protein D7V91_07495 [bacterium 1xD42-67]|nr:hypothetical protein D7V91_07495 [bacterium 1xD42-67]